MTGFSFYVAVKLRPLSLVVEFCPAEPRAAEPSAGGHVSDERIEVEEIGVLYANRRLGFR